MITKRIIPCLDVKDGKVVKGVNFEKLKEVASPVELAKFYSANGADEFTYKNLPKFPDARRDIALLVDEKYTCAEVEEVLSHSCKYVTKVEMFDLYRGKNLPEGKKSMAFALTFAVPETAEKPFSADDLDGFVKKILNNLKFKLGIELR